MSGGGHGAASSKCHDSTTSTRRPPSSAEIVSLCRKRKFGAAAEMLKSHVLAVKASLLDFVARRG